MGQLKMPLSDGAMQTRYGLSRRSFGLLLAAGSAGVFVQAKPSSAPLFPLQPTAAARPLVLWMWMGSNISRSGVTRDLEAMHEAGIGGAVIFSLSDITTSWASSILKSPTPEIVTFTEPWWQMIRHAALEARRLGLELILHNCAGYESSGGRWITPELSMQELVWTERRVTGPQLFRDRLARPTVDPHPHALFPNVYIPSLGKIGKPVVESRNSAYQDVAVLALPAEGAVDESRIVEVTGMRQTDGDVTWQAPEGDWILYRIGHTTTGAMIQPAQWDAMGLECDKMNSDAVRFHVGHVLADLKKYLPDLIGNGISTLYFDSYEAGDPTWTPRMREEFLQRRGYAITPWLATFAGRVIGDAEKTERFKQDFKRTVKDLYRDCYWRTASTMAREAGLQFGAEPYDGPWDIAEIVPMLDRPTAEFWTNGNKYLPVEVDKVAEAAHRAGKNVIAAEAFTSAPAFAKWTEHPAWLKPIGDAAFCAGINRVAIHHFVQQPWSDAYKPGNTMGQWGIHLGRNQTWWEPGKAWLAYLWRCQTLLQRGMFVPAEQGAVSVAGSGGKLDVKSIRRRDGDSEIFFMANTPAAAKGIAVAECSFPVTGKQPILYDPVWDTQRELPEYREEGGRTVLTMAFAPGQSFFVIFSIFSGIRNKRSKTKANFPAMDVVAEIAGPWRVSFDPRWGGPPKVEFDELRDWTKHEQPGIRYYSGTAVYRKQLLLDHRKSGGRWYLDLGSVRHIAKVRLNGEDLGVIWTAPWQIDISQALRKGANDLEIAVTNVWANRLIGDEQEPSDCKWTESTEKTGWGLTEFPDWFLSGKPRSNPKRLTFTTWNYFTRDSALEPSGLLGPVRLLRESEV